MTPTPDPPDIPPVPKPPGVPPVPAVPDVPKVPDAASMVPKPPEIPKVPEVPKMPAMPKVPEMPKVPGAPPIPQMPKMPGVPDIPKVPDLPKVPGAPPIPGVPSVPGAPSVPAAAVSAAVSAPIAAPPAAPPAPPAAPPASPPPTGGASGGGGSGGGGPVPAPAAAEPAGGGEDLGPDIRLEFQVKGLDPATFTPVKFEGTEAISELYRFEIDLVSQEMEIDAGKVVGQPSVLTIDRSGDITKFHGFVAEFEMRGRGNDKTNFRAVLVPRLNNLGHTLNSQIFLNKPNWKIVEEVLKEHGMSLGRDYEIRINEPGPDRDYVVQYQESDLDFIRRLMEYEGIFFFFEHGPDQEKMIIGNLKEKYKPIEGEATIAYRDSRDVGPGGEAVGELIFRQHQLSKDVLLKDYNYRKPTLEIKGAADVVPSGWGTFMEYGDHFKDPEDGGRLATIRAEEQSCRQKQFFGRSACRHFRGGSTFTLQDHFISAFNGKYLITAVRHTAHQLGAVGGATGAPGQKPGYLNYFTAIPADVLFRPRRITPKPRIWGYMKAMIDASGSGEYAEIDDLGRYKVRLPFDLSDAAEGKASHFVRMAQPYSGPGMGMHFPLHKGTEVLLIHLDGDPDRPIIVGSVPTPDQMSPVTGANQTQSVIHTGGGNRIAIEDNKGGQRVAMSSPTSGTYFSIGAPPE